MTAAALTYIKNFLQKSLRTAYQRRIKQEARWGKGRGFDWILAPAWGISYKSFSTSGEIETKTYISQVQVHVNQKTVWQVKSFPNSHVGGRERENYNLGWCLIL